jgi:hypothetical protein
MTVWGGAGLLVALAIALAVGTIVGPAELLTSPAAQSQFTGWFVIGEVLALLVVAPVAGVLACAWARRTTDRWRCGADVGSSGASRQVLVAVLLFATGVVVGSGAVGGAIVGGMIPSLPRWLAVLWSATALLGAIGALSGAYCRQALDAVAIAVGVSSVSCLAWLALGPVVESFSVAATAAALSVSPVVTVASASAVDIFHLEPIYQLSFIAHGQASYPPPVPVGVGYLTVAAALYALAGWRLDRPGATFR